MGCVAVHPFPDFRPFSAVFSAGGYCGTLPFSEELGRLARHFAPRFREWGESEKPARRLGLSRLGLLCLGHLARRGLWFYPRRLHFSIWRWEVCTSAASRANLPRPSGAVTATYARHVAQSGARPIFAAAARGRLGVAEPIFQPSSQVRAARRPIFAYAAGGRLGVAARTALVLLWVASRRIFADAARGRLGVAEPNFSHPAACCLRTDFR